MSKKETLQHPGMPFYELPISVRISDTDMFQHINNVSYATYVEAVRFEFFKAIGGDVRNELAMTKHLHIDYLNPATLYDDLVSLVKVLKVGNSSLEMEIYIVNSNDYEKIYAKAVVLQIHCCAKTGRICRVGDSIRAGLKRIGQAD